MVLTPTLRGLFGINLDAATNTITVNPHLPASWTHAEIKNIRLGDHAVNLTFIRDKGMLSVGATAESATQFTLRSDVPGARLSKHSVKQVQLLEIPLPPLELVLPLHQLPSPGSRPIQPKILSTQYSPGKLITTISAPADSTAELAFQKNGNLPNLRVSDDFSARNPGAKAQITARVTLDGPPDPRHDGPESVEIYFPQGQGWQTFEFTLTW